jgi:hypothetical protein
VRTKSCAFAVFLIMEDQDMGEFSKAMYERKWGIFEDEKIGDSNVGNMVLL